METFEIRDLSFSYPEQSRQALCGLSLSVHPGEFLVVCGPSGCGKSTLLRQLKPMLAPHGVRSGEILFEGQPLHSLDRRRESAAIGFVQQSPENQIVTDKVWHELAFGPESLGMDTPTIRRRVAEMASFFGIQTWFHKDVAELSGGQKQLLNLASVMVMQPTVLILDEPTSQLDPIAASDFLATVGKINRELGTTVILTEHRLEEALPLADRVAVLDNGRLLCADTPRAAGARLRESGHAMFLAMPTAMRVWAAVETDAPCPITVRDGRDWLAEYASKNPLQPAPAEPVHPQSEETAISCEELWFKYDRNLPDVVRGLSLTVKKGEFLALLGGNGTGKTTSLKLLAGLMKPYRGTVGISGSVGMLPQDPQTMFVKKTVREDLFELLRGSKLSKDEREARVARVVTLCRLEALLDRHPYDLSGGEQQRAALAKVLLTDPEILLLDEPTKGLDAEFKQQFAGILQALLHRGVTIVMVSHDVEFCARYAHRCALFFDGSIVNEAPPRAFFSGNSFYTTSANRIARSICPDAVTPEDLMVVCGGSLPEPPELPEDLPLPPPAEGSADWKPKKLPWWRKLAAVLSLAAALGVFVKAAMLTDLTQLVTAEGLAAPAMDQLLLYGLCIAALIVFAAAIGRRSPPPVSVQTPKGQRKLAKRTVFACVMILLLIPLTLFVGFVYLDDRKYYFIMLLVLLECMTPFFLIFEGRKPKARELVVIAVMVAIGVASRAVFFMLPEFKPVVAITIIAGVAFGGESGFLVGAMMMLVSNVLFGQGPWTPWQMFSMGLIGFLAGVLFRKGLLRRSRGSLAVFGAFVSIVIYGGIMNPMSELIWAKEFNRDLLLSYYITGFPVDCVRAAATAIFLWFAAEPFLEKLDRIKVKYGLVE